MSIGTALKTKTQKAILAGTVIMTGLTFGATGIASAHSNNNNWNSNKRETCTNSFRIYNRETGKWVRVGYNERTNRWEVCRDRNNNYKDGNWRYDNDNRYWNGNGRYEYRYRD